VFTPSIQQQSASTIGQQVDNQSPSTSQVQSFNVNRVGCNQIVLATAIIKIKSPESGQTIACRALIDPGSQSTIITEQMVQLLQLKKEKASVQIYGAGQNSLGYLKSKVSCIIANIKEDQLIDVNGYVMKEITQCLPEVSFIPGNWLHLKELDLADPNYNKRGKIDVLIGADLYRKILLEGVRLGLEGAPVAQATIFGWILTGEIEKVQTPITRLFHVHIDLDVELRKFWELEEVLEKKHYTEEEEKCEKHFLETYKRLANGTYEVRLPFIENGHLGFSRKFAVARLMGCEKQFLKNRELETEYKKCMQEYISLGHMEKVASVEDPAFTNYLPHHAVIKESSSTTKTRVVFDAKRATTSGTSLNDILLKGPVIQEDLTTQIVKWRKYRIAFTADLEKMYRQIRVNNIDAERQRTVWRNKRLHLRYVNGHRIAKMC
jgi:hypothetical protein